MNMPSWLLLLWCGLGGTCAAAVVGSVLGSAAPASWSLDPRPRSFGRAAAWSVGAGLLVYPLAYGVLFEALNRSDFTIGLLAGAVHGLIALVVHHSHLTGLSAARIAAMHVAYGATLAFLYVTP